MATLFIALTLPVNPASAKSWLAVNGRIDRDMADYVANNVTDGTKFIVVNSAGGEIAEALRIADIIVKHEIDVVVDRFCISACAHIIFAAGRKRFVKEDALVVFHGSATGFLESFGGRSDRERVAEIATLSAAEISLYRRRGINEALLPIMTAMLDPLCLDDFGPAAAPAKRLALSSEGAGWTPSIGLLRSVGFDVEGDWPANLAAFGNRLERLRLSESNLRFVFGEAPGVGIASLQSAASGLLATIPDCTLATK